MIGMKLVFFINITYFFQINLKIPKLQKDAIPCLFPGPKYLSNPQKKRKSPQKEFLWVVIVGILKA